MITQLQTIRRYEGPQWFIEFVGDAITDPDEIAECTAVGVQVLEDVVMGWVPYTRVIRSGDYDFLALETLSLYQQVEERIANTPELQPHKDAILYDWTEGDEHLSWALTAPVSEIVTWAEAIEVEQAGEKC